MMRIILHEGWTVCVPLPWLPLALAWHRWQVNIHIGQRLTVAVGLPVERFKIERRPDRRRVAFGVVSASWWGPR